MWWLVGAIALGLFIYWIQYSLSNESSSQSSYDNGLCSGFLTVILGVVTIGLFIAGIEKVFHIESKPTPKAIDVYRGNTTLEITYKDSIPTDTIVVWKN